MDKVKLTKLLGMTRSSSDGEALNAMRMANALIEAAGSTWEEVLKDADPARVVTVTVTRHGFQQDLKPDETWIAPHLKDKVIIDLMFRAVYATDVSAWPNDFRKFMTSIHERWHKYGNLTQGQYNALKNCYNRVKRATAT